MAENKIAESSSLVLKLEMKRWPSSALGERHLGEPGCLAPLQFPILIRLDDPVGRP